MCFLFEDYHRGSHRFMPWEADVFLFISCDKPVDIGHGGTFWTSADVAAAALAVPGCCPCDCHTSVERRHL